MTSIKGHNTVTNKQTITGSNPKLDIVNINAYGKNVKFCPVVFQILS